jgi:citrate lyase subunit beta/citryl-CoA lyase
MVRLRSQLYVPGDKPEWMRKALDAGADGLILDLEDGVAPARRAAAREAVARFLAEHGGGRTLLFVRVSEVASPELLHDLLAVVRPGLAGVVLPKVHQIADVTTLDRVLSWLEDDRGLAAGTTALVPLLETAGAMYAAREIFAASPRVAYAGGIVADAGDTARAVGFRWTGTATETLALRSLILLGARAAGAPWPMGGVWTDLDDLEGLRGFAEQNRALGYDGMVVIHPAHVAIVNEVFGDDPDELAGDAELRRAVEEAVARGEGAVAHRGKMVDLAMARTAEQRLRAARER